MTRSRGLYAVESLLSTISSAVLPLLNLTPTCVCCARVFHPAFQQLPKQDVNKAAKSNGRASNSHSPAIEVGETQSAQCNPGEPFRTRKPYRRRWSLDCLLAEALEQDCEMSIALVARNSTTASPHPRGLELHARLPCMTSALISGSWTQFYRAANLYSAISRSLA